MSAEETPIRRADPRDDADIARLLHDFNTEFSDFTPGVAALTGHARKLLEEGEMTVLLGGDGPDGLSITRFRTSVWTGLPEAHLQSSTWRRSCAGAASAGPCSRRRWS